VTNDPTQGDGSPPALRTVAALVAEGEIIAWVGAATDSPACDVRRDLGSRAVVPGFVDSHLPLVFDGGRSAQFTARMGGVCYDGGGITTGTFGRHPGAGDRPAPRPTTARPAATSPV